MWAFGLDRTAEQSLPAQRFLPCGNRLSTANFQPIICLPLIPSLPFLLSVSQTVWKKGREWKRESLTSLFDTPHVCLLKNSLVCQLGPVSIDKSSVTSLTGFTSVCTCQRAGAGGLWDVIHSLCLLSSFTCRPRMDFTLLHCCRNRRRESG